MKTPDYITAGEQYIAQRIADHRESEEARNAAKRGSVQTAESIRIRQKAFLDNGGRERGWFIRERKPKTPDPAKQQAAQAKRERKAAAALARKTTT